MEGGFCCLSGSGWVRLNRVNVGVERWWGHRGVIIHQSLTGSTAGPVESKSDTYQRCSLY